ncbi:MAG: hypothetical protein WC996_07475 [Peptostreptococcales bacterium]
MCKIKKNCNFCHSFTNEEVGDSDYGAIYDDNPTCFRYLDLDDDGNPIEGFDREIERDCCRLDFFMVLEHDEELKEMLSKEMDLTGRYDETYLRFKQKYS